MSFEATIVAKCFRISQRYFYCAPLSFFAKQHYAITCNFANTLLTALTHIQIINQLNINNIRQKSRHKEMLSSEYLLQDLGHR